MNDLIFLDENVFPLHEFFATAVFRPEEYNGDIAWQLCATYAAIVAYRELLHQIQLLKPAENLQIIQSMFILTFTKIKFLKMFLVWKLQLIPRKNSEINLLRPAHLAKMLYLSFPSTRGHLCKFSRRLERNKKKLKRKMPCNNDRPTNIFHLQNAHAYAKFCVESECEINFRKMFLVF